MTSIVHTEAHKPLDITLAGETNLDLILYGLPEDLAAERELLGSEFKITLGGSSSILAHNLAILGTSVGFTSQVGDDEMADIALSRLAESGLELSHVTRRQHASTGVTLLLPHGKRRHILTYPGVMSELSVPDLDMTYLKSSRHFHLSSLFLQTGLHAGLPALFDALKAAGLTISLDTNDDPSDLWGGVLDELLDKIDILLPNQDELAKIAHATSTEEALEKLASRVKLIVVKCGSRGAIVQQRKQRDWIAPVQVDAIDTIGAGDSFNAGFLSAYLRGKDALAAAAFGNVTGAFSTLRQGGTEAYRDASLRNEFFLRHTLT